MKNTVQIDYAQGLNAALIIENMRKTCEHKFAKRKTGYTAKNQCLKCGTFKQAVENQK